MLFLRNREILTKQINKFIFKRYYFKRTIMTHERKTEIFKELFDSCIELQLGKAKDYASDIDALSNFKSQDAEALGLTPFQKWGVYFGKQAMSIMNAIGKTPDMPSTTSEPIEERIQDSIIYLVLLKCLLEDTKNEFKQHENKSSKVFEKIKPQVKIHIIKSANSLYNFTFSESSSLQLNQEFFIYNENDPYTQYKCNALQIIKNNTFECFFIEKKTWSNGIWNYELFDYAEIQLNDTWFLAQL